MINPSYAVFHMDTVTMRPHPSFIPKVLSDFHINQFIHLPSPPQKNPKNFTCCWPNLNNIFYVGEGCCYITWTELNLFLKLQDSLWTELNLRGMAISSQIFLKWVRFYLIAYDINEKNPALNIRTYFTRAQTEVITFLSQISILKISRAATWSSAHTFTYH